ncbi:Polysaccharide deacetylase [Verrucomicrobium sp. GAS474]|uniref:polysaccharide deacetylase family protein n=1 Tax=Verrucomicrobium sp. GAS474 TaxID=1882831 RepID=UPI00087A39E4|nr:polysaccharide deacetylase family protein [Verrucomicrobium sp. GAS474]SDT88681.1 Polysaccharide deacetylase [Verrucomicrobium sp. GAS474]
MSPIRFSLFPGGRTHAVTLSYDDGQIHDRKMVAILNRHGLKGTFHLNSGTLGGGSEHLAPGEIAALFEGHEVSAHTVTHPHLDGLPDEQLILEVLDDRRALEQWVPYPVRGMSYPYGTVNGRVAQLLPRLGIEYCRVGTSHGRFHLPEDLLRWEPTCHHNHDLLAKTEAFLATRALEPRLRLLYVWGHSFEFHREDNWDLLERFGARLAGEGASIWFATNFDIADYLQCLRRLRATVDGRRVQNPSHRPVWIEWAGAAREIAPGAVASL